MIVYKVVREVDGHLLSAFVGHQHGEMKELIQYLEVEYFKNKKVTAPIGKLFAFDTLSNAKGFNLGNQIWLAQATGVKVLRRMLYTDARSIAALATSYWRRGSHEKPTGHPGTGVVVCDSIKLIHKVKSE